MVRGTKTTTHSLPLPNVNASALGPNSSFTAYHPPQRQIFYPKLPVFFKFSYRISIVGSDMGKTRTRTRAMKDKRRPSRTVDLPQQNNSLIITTRKRKSLQLIARSMPLQAKASFSRNNVIRLYQGSRSSLRLSKAPDLCAFYFPHPGVSIAFSDGDYDATLLAQNQDDTSPSTAGCEFKEITHVIRISHLSACVPRRCFQRKYPPDTRHSYRNGLAWSDYDVDSGIATLDLVVPRKPQVPSSATRLTDSQLELAKGFLDLVFLWPTAPQGWPDYLNPRIPDPFNILITEPFCTLKRSKSRTHFPSPDSLVSTAEPQSPSLSPGSRDILALIGDRIGSDHANVFKKEDVFLLLEEMVS